VLDRVDDPLELLGELRLLVASGGVLVISVPLPLQHFIRRATLARLLLGTTPTQPLPEPKRLISWEHSASHIQEHVFRPLGLKTLLVSRESYLCRGRPFHALDSAVFVLSPTAVPAMNPDTSH